MKILSVNLGSTSSVTSKTKDNVSLLYFIPSSSFQTRTSCFSGGTVIVYHEFLVQSMGCISKLSLIFCISQGLESGNLHILVPMIP